VLSPRDWELVLEWHAREIPLGVILEVLEEAGARSRARGSSGPRSLVYLAAAVEETWALIRRGRLDPLGGASPESPSVSEVRAAWARACDRSGEGAAVSALLRGLLARLDGGESADAIDRELDGAIADAAPTELVDRLRREVRDELASYRDRIPGDRLERTSRRAIVTRLRRALGLPRLPDPD
jgi:hypothetical protein